MSIRLTQVELQSEEDTVIFLASGHLYCVEQVKPLLEAENFLEDHDGEDIEVSLSIICTETKGRHMTPTRITSV